MYSEQYKPQMDHNLRDFVVTTVILTPGAGNPGSVLGGLTPFLADPADPLNPLESSRGLQKRYENHQN